MVVVLAVVRSLRRPSLRCPDCGARLALRAVGTAPRQVPVGEQGQVVCPADCLPRMLVEVATVPLRWVSSVWVRRARWRARLTEFGVIPMRFNAAAWPTVRVC
eukprot:7631256-Pyramimonas_sp.AAC.2